MRHCFGASPLRSDRHGGGENRIRRLPIDFGIFYDYTGGGVVLSRVVHNDAIKVL